MGIETLRLEANSGVLILVYFWSNMHYCVGIFVVGFVWGIGMGRSIESGITIPLYRRYMQYMQQVIPRLFGLWYWPVHEALNTSTNTYPSLHFASLHLNHRPSPPLNHLKIISLANSTHYQILNALNANTKTDRPRPNVPR